MQYIYWCGECQEHFEQTKSMKDATLAEPCPKCSNEAGRDFGAENSGPATYAIRAGMKYPYVSRRLPKNLAGCQTNHLGQPIIESARHEKEIARQHGYRRE